MSYVEFSIGADPEIFVRKKGKGISAHGLVPGTKSEPFQVPDGAVQVDGMALEFNINPSPLRYNGFETFENNVTSVLGTLKEMVKEKDAEINFNINSVQEFDEDYFKEVPDDAKELGCDPDYNAYTGEVNPRPPGDRPFRTASGHIHVGWGADIPVDHPDHHDICRAFVKMLDATLGMYMTVIDPEPRRRDLYGKAGAYRPKPYGVEYRTPSNVWLQNRARRKAIFELTEKAVALMRGEVNFEKKWGVSEKMIEEIINTGDFTRAYGILNYINMSYGFDANTWRHISSEYRKRENPLDSVIEKNKQGKTPPEIAKASMLKDVQWTTAGTVTKW